MGNDRNDCHENISLTRRVIILSEVSLFHPPVGGLKMICGVIYYLKIDINFSGTGPGVGQEKYRGNISRQFETINNFGIN